MASVFEGIISSRRRTSRSRSWSGKQLHSRWGDAAITAPHIGWSQQHPEEDLNESASQAHGSPDSQKTLVDNSPDVSYGRDKVTRGIVEPSRQPAPPIVQKERSAIVITIPLPWTRKTHPRSLSIDRLQSQDSQQVTSTTAQDSSPAHVSAGADMEARAVAEDWPLVDPLRSRTSAVYTTLPPYDHVKGPLSEREYSGNDYGPGRLPQIQTGVPPARSQPASAVSILSPVAESFHGRSESNNATPKGQTPIAQMAGDGVATTDTHQGTSYQNLMSQLDTFLPRTPRSVLPSLFASPTEAFAAESEATNAQNTSKVSSRPESRGLAAEGAAYMRNKSRSGDEQRSGSRDAVSERRRRSASRGPSDVESMRRRPNSRDTMGNRTPRQVSRQPAGRRADSPDPCGRGAMSHAARSQHTSRNASREPALRPDQSPGPLSPNKEFGNSFGQLISHGSSHGGGARGRLPMSPMPLTAPRARGTSTRRPGFPGTRSERILAGGPAVPLSPSIETIRIMRRAHSREAYGSQRASSPGTLGGALGTDVQSGPATPHRTSDDTGRRAVSVDPVRRTVGPRDDIIIHWASLPTQSSPATSQSSDSSFTSVKNPPSPENGADSESDAESEAQMKGGMDDVYFESRKGWNGPAGMKGVDSKGFYGDVVQDYKAIARDVEAELAQAYEPPPSATFNIVNLVVNKMDKDRDRDKEKEGENDKETERVSPSYGGPELVPSHEELWG
ncbi:hypothetical protein A1O1_00998 [Capronia coronata CBS 617.96]|uniref:Uncharacterized protein n=1 Tax=Capronia coronata CBS 617.96 TaxID=1182541 RepID=W9YTP3_9EURO|nr:uncharacterized protein A1O1_00998 [Capronia coronata CBS 617.96]EXJ95873.1 hypothetical protein A1O1_00998 [Capronia coronata CBS 617.96]